MLLRKGLQYPNRVMPKLADIVVPLQLPQEHLEHLNMIFDCVWIWEYPQNIQTQAAIFIYHISCWLKCVVAPLRRAWLESQWCDTPHSPSTAGRFDCTVPGTSHQTLQQKTSTPPSGSLHLDDRTHTHIFLETPQGGLMPVCQLLVAPNRTKKVSH